MPESQSGADPRPSALDQALRIFGDVRAGEGARVVLMFANVFVLLLAYYILKTVREPLILEGGGAELKTYASAAQAATLVLYVPLYGWVASRLPRFRLIVTVVLFFFACLELFFLAGGAGLPFVGFVYYVWVGIFNLTMIAQFWSYANDIYSRPDGERLFPLIAIGSTLGAPFGAFLSARLFDTGISPFVQMQVAAALLLLHLGLYVWIARHWDARRADTAVPALDKKGGFVLVLRSRYLLYFAVTLVLLNVVNTTGEYLFDRHVTEAATAEVARAAQQEPGLGAEQKDEVERSFIGSIKGDYLTGVSILAFLLQAFVASRLVAVFGIGVVFVLPLVSLGFYSVAAVGASLTLMRWGKTAENGTDYSIMNTAKQLLWLPTTREEKYKAKQAIDTFFVRIGDMLAAGVVYAGTHWLALSPLGFARANVAVVLVWLGLTLLLYRENRRLTAAERERVVPDAVAAPA
jgi:AAA family ATP:ADP antiporter